MRRLFAAAGLAIDREAEARYTLLTDLFQNCILPNEPGKLNTHAAAHFQTSNMICVYNSSPADNF
jgi:hypothetical protein